MGNWASRDTQLVLRQTSAISSRPDLEKYPFRRSENSHMSCSSKLLKGCYTRAYLGDFYRDVKGDTRSLDYSSYCGSGFGVSNSRRVNNGGGIPSHTLNPKP